MCFYLGKFTNNFFAPRKLESLQKTENIYNHHTEIQRQSTATIFSQFSNHSANLPDYPSEYITADAIYTVL